MFLPPYKSLFCHCGVCLQSHKKREIGLIRDFQTEKQHFAEEQKKTEDANEILLRKHREANLHALQLLKKSAGVSLEPLSNTGDRKLSPHRTGVLPRVVVAVVGKVPPLRIDKRREKR